MIIPGTDISLSIKESLKKQISSLNVAPHLAVVIVGNDPSSITYINRKKKMGEDIGMMVSIYRLKPDDLENLYTVVKILNEDEEVHGIIIQRPVPLAIKKEDLDTMVLPQKDVDGFHPQTKFQSPIGSAILEILKWVYGQSTKEIPIESLKPFTSWVVEKKILVIGRGTTGGAPIAQTLKKNKIEIEVAHSQTQNLKELCLASDIVISCVGKSNIVRHDMVTKKTILLGVGMHPDVHPDDLDSLKFAPDYNVDEVKDIVAFYTPVPGGVGPVNVACLLKNVVEAAKLTTK